MMAIKVGIIGANGYTGEELCRLALHHPQIELACIASRKLAGQALSAALPRFARSPGADLKFIQPELSTLLASGAEVFFLSLPHGVAAEFAVPLLEAGKRVIDLSADFRLRDAINYEAFYENKHLAPALLKKAVYGLPEIYGDSLARCQLIACPGCYPTSMLLPLLPLVRAGLIEREGIFVSSASGTSGAGRKNDDCLLFAECNESLKAYGIPKHRHLSEVEQELSIATGQDVRITFVPHLAPMTRGIHTTIFARPVGGIGADAVRKEWELVYKKAPFVRLSANLPDTKQVTGTNFCDVAVRFDERTNTFILLSAIDNLIKGAGGQAIQCFNRIYEFEETLGLIDL